MLVMHTGDYGDFKTLVQKFRANDIVTYFSAIGASAGVFAATAINRDNPVQIFFDVQTGSAISAEPPTFATDFPQAIQISNFSGASWNDNTSAWIPGTHEFWATNYADFKAVTDALNFGGPIVYFNASGGGYFQAYAASYDTRFLAILFMSGIGVDIPASFLTDFPDAIALNSPSAGVTHSPIPSSTVSIGAALDQYFPVGF
jgi:hypothetical protein